MKVKCKKSYYDRVTFNIQFTAGRWYDCEEDYNNDDGSYIITDDGNQRWAFKDTIFRYFHTVDELREIEIDKILEQ